MKSLQGARLHQEGVPSRCLSVQAGTAMRSGRSTTARSSWRGRQLLRYRHRPEPIPHPRPVCCQVLRVLDPRCRRRLPRRCRQPWGEQCPSRSFCRESCRGHDGGAAPAPRPRLPSRLRRPSPPLAILPGWPLLLPVRRPSPRHSPRRLLVRRYGRAVSHDGRAGAGPRALRQLLRAPFPQRQGQLPTQVLFPRRQRRFPGPAALPPRQAVHSARPWQRRNDDAGHATEFPPRPARLPHWGARLPRQRAPSWPVARPAAWLPPVREVGPALPTTDPSLTALRLGHEVLASCVRVSGGVRGVRPLLSGRRANTFVPREISPGRSP